MDAADYCREIEAYLCQRNEGHLVRISGPAFDLVCGWARTGIPIKVAMQGIDRHLQRLEHKGPRRRPLRIEFCEADVLDAFDAWRRAVGVRMAGPDATDEGVDEGDAPAKRRPPLAAHLARAIGRLVALRTGPSVSSAWDATLDALVRRLDAMQTVAKSARGDAREALVTELAALDAELVTAALQQLDAAAGADIAREAEQELAPFAVRMPAAAYADALRRCRERLVRERLALPQIAVD